MTAIASSTPTATITATPTYEGCGLPLGGDPESTEEPICYIITPQPTATPTASPTIAFVTNTPIIIPTLVPTSSGDPDVRYLQDTLITFDTNRYVQRTEAECEQSFGGQQLLQCQVHVRLLQLIANRLNGTAPTHGLLIELIAESEYINLIGEFGLAYRHWVTESVARRFYSQRHGCGVDGCGTDPLGTPDGTNVPGDELYVFLSYYQPLREYDLSPYYDRIVDKKILSPTDQDRIDLEEVVALVFNPPTEAETEGGRWTNGIVLTNHVPFGFATLTGVQEAQLSSTISSQALCNDEQFVYSYATSGQQPNRTFNIFFGTVLDREYDIVQFPQCSIAN